MNTLIANRYGRVQGEVNGSGLTITVTAQNSTPGIGPTSNAH